MDYAEAVELVTADVNEGYEKAEWCTPEEAVAHTRNTISLESPAPMGAVTLVDYEDKLTEAYRIVLS